VTVGVEVKIGVRVLVGVRVMVQAGGRVGTMTTDGVGVTVMDRWDNAGAITPK